MPGPYYLPPAGGGQPYHGPGYGQSGGIHYLPPAGGGNPYRGPGYSGGGGYGGAPSLPPSPPPASPYGGSYTTANYFAPRGQMMYSQTMNHPGNGYPGADCPACQRQQQTGGAFGSLRRGGGAAGYGGPNIYAP